MGSSIHNGAPTFNSISDEDTCAHRDEPIPTTSGTSVAEEECQINKREKWSRFWHTIMLSCLDNTLYPYCQHLRTLNLGHLANLLKDPFFQRSDTCKYAIYSLLFSLSLTEMQIPLSRSTRAIPSKDISIQRGSWIRCRGDYQESWRR